jgi:hypothetical protein
VACQEEASPDIHSCSKSSLVMPPIGPVSLSISASFTALPQQVFGPSVWTFRVNITKTQIKRIKTELRSTTRKVARWLNTSGVRPLTGSMN